MRFARIDSRESFAIETPIFIARQADLPESLKFPIRANHGTKGHGLCIGTGRDSAVQTSLKILNRKFQRTMKASSEGVKLTGKALRYLWRLVKVNPSRASCKILEASKPKLTNTQHYTEKPGNHPNLNKKSSGSWSEKSHPRSNSRNSRAFSEQLSELHS